LERTNLTEAEEVKSSNACGCALHNVVNLANSTPQISSLLDELSSTNLLRDEENFEKTIMILQAKLLVAGS
jgi:hypothetical protein